MRAAVVQRAEPPFVVRQRDALAAGGHGPHAALGQFVDGRENAVPGQRRWCAGDAHRRRGWRSRPCSPRPIRRGMLPCAGMPPASLSMRATCRRFHVMNTVLRAVKSFSGPPEPCRGSSGRGRPRRSSRSRPAAGSRTQALQRVEDVHRAVLDAVLVAGDDAPRRRGRSTRTARSLRSPRSRTAARSPGCRRSSSRRARSGPSSKDVRGQHLPVDARASRRGRAVLGHVRLDTGREVWSSADDLDLDALVRMSRWRCRRAPACSRAR